VRKVLEKLHLHGFFAIARIVHAEPASARERNCHMFPADIDQKKTRKGRRRILKLKCYRPVFPAAKSWLIS
jgi:hypothetical protein